MMKLKTDKRKLKAVIFIGLSLCAASILAASNLDNRSQLIWILFLLCSGLLFIGIGLFTKSRFILTNDYLEATDLLRLSRKRISLADITKVQSIHKDFPATAHVQNPLWLVLWDKKFKKIKQLKLYNREKKIFSIDGHLLEDKEYEWLKKKLKKPVYNKA